MSQLILLRHGQSEWNKKNIFTGWIDIPLSTQGIQEALSAGEKIKEISIDKIFTSTLSRASMTALLAMSVHTSGVIPATVHEGSPWYEIPEGMGLIPMIVSEALNERMYGKLQGKNKDRIKKEFGEEQFVKWRRSYSHAPPEGESLKMTAERTLPYFTKKVLPELEKGQNILISAHGNSLRSIIMKLNNLSEEQVINLEIPTGEPILYTYTEGRFFT